MARKASDPSKRQWAQMRASQANRSYGNRRPVKRGMEPFGGMRTLSMAREQLVDPEYDIWEGAPTSADDPAYGGPDPGTQGRYDLIAEAFEWAGEEYFAHDDAGFGFRNLAVTPIIPTTSSRDQAAAPISVVPTNTINPDRPRTVAAGYDPARGVLTTVFRDGTFYNYYDVSAREWQAFKLSRSKGRYILRVLDAKPRGIADVQAVPVTVRAALYTAGRAIQATGDERWQQPDLVARHIERRRR